MKTRNGPRVIFPVGFDERAAVEAPLKGWLSAQVELEDGCRYAVYFSDPIRLQQDVDDAVQNGRPCFAEPGLIIVPEVTVQSIEAAVQFLWKQGFFASLRADQSEGADATTTAPNTCSEGGCQGFFNSF
jgi:hypothetical protein